jgi:hypothetical protein
MFMLALLIKGLFRSVVEVVFQSVFLFENISK